MGAEAVDVVDVEGHGWRLLQASGDHRGRHPLFDIPERIGIMQLCLRHRQASQRVPLRFHKDDFCWNRSIQMLNK